MAFWTTLDQDVGIMLRSHRKAEETGNIVLAVQ
jgi:hypothetical protein